MTEPQTRAYRGKNAETRATERKQRLMATGLELFSSQGYARTTIEALCAEAKVTARHFYQLFDSREELLLAIYEQILDELREGVLQAMLTPGLSVDAQIESAVKASVRHYLADARRARIGVLEVVGVSPKLEARRRRAIQDMASLVENHLNQLFSKHCAKGVNAHFLALAFVGGINELLAHWLTMPEPPTADALGDEIVQILNSLIRGAKP